MYSPPPHLYRLFHVDVDQVENEVANNLIV